MTKIFSLLACLAWLTAVSQAQPGSTDGSFGLNGAASFLPQPILNKAYGINLTSDQKILIGGYGLDGGANAFILLRLFPNGVLDTSFGIQGVVKNLLGTDALCYATGLQPDGKILLAGGAATAANGSKDFALLRCLPNGDLDSSFSGDGIQTISFGSGDDIAKAVTVQPDGNILIAGTSTNGNNSLMAIARFKPDGSPDLTFSSDGKNTIAIGTIFTNAYAMALTADGKILLAGAAKFGMADDVALARFLPDGSVDQNFGSQGHVATDLGSDADSGNSIAIQADGKILVAGISGQSRDFVLLRYWQDGVLDTDFGNQGVVKTDFAASDDYANAVLLQPDGKILVGGYAYQSALPDFALVRYLSDGTADPDFGTNGKVSYDFSGGYDYAFPLSIQPDGKILQAGYTYSNGHTAFAAVRYISGLNVGTLDFTQALLGFVSPNPIGSTGEFSFETIHAASLTLGLYDLQGHRIQSFFENQLLPSGKHVEKLNFSDGLPDGWYLLQLSDGAQRCTIKVLKQ